MLVDDYPVSLVCELLGCSRSSYYYQPNRKDETEVKSAIEKVAAEWPTYGYRRVTKQLQRKGWDLNKKRVQRLMREMGLLARNCLLYTSPSPRDLSTSRMPSSA